MVKTWKFWVRQINKHNLRPNSTQHPTEQILFLAYVQYKTEGEFKKIYF